ncbi:MAG TPA: DNA methyltransferase [Phycisphaerae bacterium]|nr:DNA methyltransferase [Phycisphaerae bacterium]
MTPNQFIAKWTPVKLSENASRQEHFLDLCRLLGQPTPAEKDAVGTEYTFEKSVAVSGPASRGSKGERGFVDVWWRGKFGWEYKRKDKHKTLEDAYRQLNQYREALQNPPLLVVCDIARIEIHTNFTGTLPRVHTVALEDLASPANLELLRRVFEDPNSLSPALEAEKVTQEVARRIGAIADTLRPRTRNPQRAAHFLMKCMFCLFAEDIGLLPKKLFLRLLEKWQHQPHELCPHMTDLFDRMRDGGDFGLDLIPWFNGGLFDKAPALKLTHNEIGTLMDAARLDWGKVEPSIFGTLFERCLDPDKRSQIGAHYTSRQDILLVVEPVVMAPLRREWAAVREELEKQLARRRAARSPKAKRKADDAINQAIQDFDHRLGSVLVLDPACGSGNFLYMAIQQLLELEREVVEFASRPEIALLLAPRVRPTQLMGIEINPFAAELAQVVLWIGYLQWMHDCHYPIFSKPILDKFQNIECRDAILDLSDPKKPKPAEWPEADFIIGNPPFLGSKLFRKYDLSEDYVAAMYGAYDLPKASDLCCYWFERARQAVERKPLTRGGLLATQGIRGGANRTVLERIKKSGDIFMAWSDRDWVLDGANVHVSIIGFDNGSEKARVLDDAGVPTINADLTSGTAAASARPLAENQGIAFMGVTPSGKFQVDMELVSKWLASPNAPGCSNADVLRPWLNAKEITGRPTGKWIIDFGCDVDLAQASKYEAPFEYVRKQVAPQRADYRTGKRAYWCFERPRPEMRNALLHMPRFLATGRVAKYRVFVWLKHPVLPDSATFVFARSDDYFLGVLQSSIHTLWALRMGTHLETRPRYTPTTCFETFPLPWTPGEEPTDGPLYRRISAAAKALDAERERWLNPPEWIEPLAATVDMAEDLSDLPEHARPLVRQSAIQAAAAGDPRLRERTLTNLYNERPTWLRLAHLEMDRAVLAAYAQVDPEGGWAEDWADVWEPSGAGQPLPKDHPLAARRAETDARVLANLLRLNQERTR